MPLFTAAALEPPNTAWQLVTLDPNRAIQADEGLVQLRRHLSIVLQCQNLVVLTGLGTSLCVVDAQGRRRAPTMADLWAAVKRATGATEFDALLREVKYPVDETGENIESLLSRCQLAQRYQSSPTVQTFIQKAEKTIAEACRFVKTGDQLQHHEAFLRRLTLRNPHQPRVQLFTTNYDLCFEHAASTIGAVAVDGFSFVEPRMFDAPYLDFDLVSRRNSDGAPRFLQTVFQLLKLHGSVDWTRRGAAILKDGTTDRPLLIYPRDTKFETSYSQPFLEMMSRLQMAIRQPNTGLIVMGFGFADAHLAQPVISAVRANPGLQMVVVDPALSKSESPSVKFLCQLVSNQDDRLVLINATFEQFVPFLPAVAQQTEEQLHQERIRQTPAPL